MGRVITGALLNNKSKKFLRGIWLFPAICTVVLILLTFFKVSGSSIGAYYPAFYGSQKDPALLLNKFRGVRSDEWVVRTPKSIAQSNNNYARVNQNIGLGEDESVSLDVPYKDWSTVFRPIDWPFFVLGFDYAFALKWWLMGYLLVISAYFFTLKLLPGRRLIAAGVGISLFFSAFVQWWYEYDTLAALFYPLLIGLAFMYLMGRKRNWHKIVFGMLIAYLFVCFALILYPPFQIATGLTLAAFVLGYLLEVKPKLKNKDFWQKIGLGVAAVLLAGIITMFFLHSRSGPVRALENTDYPGRRITQSGGFSFTNFLSGNLDFQLQFSAKAARYLPGGAPTNQSEASSFILLLPFLLLPSLYMLWLDRRNKKPVDWPLLAVNILFILLLIRLFVPYFSGLFNLFGFGRVPHQRLMIGIGLLSVLQMVLVIRWLQARNKMLLSVPLAAVYSALVFIAEIFIGLSIYHTSPGYIGFARLIAFSLPIPLIIYAIIRKKFEWALCLFVLFSLVTSAAVNPLYRGTKVLRDTPLSNKIQQITKYSDGKWIAEGLMWENFPQMNGAPSLSGVYAYPQLAEWRPIDNGKQQYIYNRYAHAQFIINGQDPYRQAKLSLIGPDHFQITTGVCSDFIRHNHVHYLLAETRLQGEQPCSHIISTITYPDITFYIYRID
jgi:MFS family permease